MIKKYKRNFFHTIYHEKSSVSTGVSFMFKDKSEGEFFKWKKSFYKILKSSLGTAPKKVPLNVEIIERVQFKDYIREKVIYDVEKDLSGVAWICRPREKKNKKFPAIICCHGHGPGKDPLVGLYKGERCLEYHKLAPVRLAQNGYIAVVPDRRGYGDCSQFVNGNPTYDNLRELDIFYQRIKGTSLVAFDIMDTIRAIDFLIERWDVDGLRIGCLGVENGAVVASVATAIDERIKAVSLSCFINSEMNMSGVSKLKTINGKAGPVEICGLICPRPIQLQIPEADPVVPFKLAVRGADRVKELYKLADSEDKLEIDIFDGVWEIDFISVLPFFNRWLKP